MEGLPRKFLQVGVGQVRAGEEFILVIQGDLPEQPDFQGYHGVVKTQTAEGFHIGVDAQGGQVVVHGFRRHRGGPGQAVLLAVTESRLEI